MPLAAQVARTKSTPLAIRMRRFDESQTHIERGKTDATPEGLTPSQHARYLRLKKLGRNVGSPEEWAARETAKRSRIRGIRTTVVDGETKVEVLGQPIYLPNVVFILTRNHTPPGEPYNPYEATFRVPLNITKTDVRSYLHAVYGVETTYIRTDVYRPSNPSRGQPQTKKAYKRAVVGLVDPFYYPNRVEDMSEEGQKEFYEKLEESWRVQEGKLERKLNVMQRTWPVRPGTVIRNPLRQRDKILAKIAERRLSREQLVSQTVQKWRDERDSGLVISLDTVATSDISQPPVPFIPEQRSE
ncbi:hypothetical protein BDZ89DRAFT_1056611 [Hymenopellis radicata]|nr:hypothetical protein BDZ89DRAFT_1056611 [Hymenopellis radicata]